MTNNQHGQVPEALIDLIDAYAETRHRYGRIHNARTEAARNAVIEALSGVQALSAAPEAKKSALRTYPNPIVPLIKPVSEQEKMRALYLASSNLMAYLGRNGAIHSDGHAADVLMNCLNDLDGGEFDETLFAASPTPPAEQQATKETSGGFHVWRDIYTAPKDGSRFVATGHNYGLYSEVRHTCVAQWFRGCWMEASDWNETSELKYLTHWMPLPSPPDDVAAPAEQQAAPKSAPGEQDDHQILAITTAYEQGVGKGHQAYNSGKEIANPYSPAYRCDLAWQYGYKEGKEQAQREAKAAPQQEAQEPDHSLRTDALCQLAYCNGMKAGWNYCVDGNEVDFARAMEGVSEAMKVLGELRENAPQPAPAPLSEMPYEKRKAIQEGEQIGASDAWFHARHNMLDTLDRRNVFRAGFDRGWNAALAAQGGK